MLNLAMEAAIAYVVEVGSAPYFSTNTMNKVQVSVVGILDTTTSILFVYTSLSTIFLRVIEATDAQNSMAPRNAQLESRCMRLRYAQE